MAWYLTTVLISLTPKKHTAKYCKYGAGYKAQAAKAAAVCCHIDEFSLVKQYSMSLNSRRKINKKQIGPYQMMSHGNSCTQFFHTVAVD